MLEIFIELNETMEHLIVKEAGYEERRIIWEWWNDQDTRKMMKKNDPVSWDEHTAWYHKFMQQNHSKMYFMYTENKKIGVVRFNYQEKNIFEVSININPLERGCGWGKKILRKAIHEMKDKKRTVHLIAMYKKENISSRNVFLGNGFIETDQIMLCDKTRNFDPNLELFCQLEI